jgi:hypothetical protein
MKTTEAQTFTANQATDEAVLLLTRKLMRLHPEAYADVTSRMPEGARLALLNAETRADVVRDADTLSGTTHTYPVLSDEDFSEA